MPQPVVPSPRTWAPNDRVLVPWLRGDVSDAVAFLAQRPLFAGQATTGASIASGSDVAIGMTAELTDTWNGHVITGGPSAIWQNYYCQAPGWYLCRNAAPLAYSGATQFLFMAGFNWVTGGVTQSTIHGGLQLCGSTNNPLPQCVDLIQQTVTGAPGGSGDFIQPTVFQNTGGAVNLQSTATELPTVSARWVCATTGTQPLPIPPLTAVPSPITSAWLNANVRDAIRFLIYPPIAKAIYVAGASTLPSQAFPAGTVVPLNSVVVDNYGGFTTGAAAKYTAPVAGSYFCYGQINLAANANSTGYCAGFSVNGGTTQWGGSVFKVSDAIGGGMTVTKRLRLAAGDTVQLIACQGSGGAIAYNTTAANQTRFIAVWDGS